MFLGDARCLVEKLVACISRLELFDLLEQRRLAHRRILSAGGGRKRCSRRPGGRLTRAAAAQVAGIERRRLVTRRIVLNPQLAGLVCANPAPVADQFVDLVVAQVGSLDALKFGRVGRHEKHIATPSSRSAPGTSRMTRLSVWLVTAKAIRAGKLALISPVMTSTDGRWVAMIK